MKHLHAVPMLLVLLSASQPGFAAAPDSVRLAQRLEAARGSYLELLGSPDHSVPEALLEKCSCVAVIPGVIKGALGWGARFGQGVVSCRDSMGAWSPPVFLRLTGGSVGFQIGAQKSDIVLFFMTEKSAPSLINSKFTLGGTASVAAGPAGRSGEASTDLDFNAEIYSYARSKGLFAGVSLEGARLVPDETAITTYYGKAVPVPTILFEHHVPRLPAEAEAFMKVLPASKR